MFIIDAHLDLAMNAMEWNRDLKQPVAQLRDREKGMTDKPDRERNTVSLPALREGKIGLVVATQIARLCKKRKSSSRLAFSGTGMGANTGPACLVSGDGGRRRNGQVTDQTALEKQIALWKTIHVQIKTNPLDLF